MAKTLNASAIDGVSDDIWPYIAHKLSANDILAIGTTCRSLHSTTTREGFCKIECQLRGTPQNFETSTWRLTYVTHQLYLQGKKDIAAKNYQQGYLKLATAAYGGHEKAMEAISILFADPNLAVIAAIRSQLPEVSEEFKAFFKEQCPSFKLTSDNETVDQAYEILGVELDGGSSQQLKQVKESLKSVDWKQYPEAELLHAILSRRFDKKVFSREDWKRQSGDAIQKLIDFFKEGKSTSLQQLFLAYVCNKTIKYKQYSDPIKARKILEGLLKLGHSPDLYLALANTCEKSQDFSAYNNYLRTAAIFGCGIAIDDLLVYSDQIQKLYWKHRYVYSYDKRKVLFDLFQVYVNDTLDLANDGLWNDKYNGDRALAILKDAATWAKEGDRLTEVALHACFKLSQVFAGKKGALYNNLSNDPTDLEEARRYSIQARQIAEELSTRKDFFADYILGMLSLQEENAEQALKYFQQALEKYKSLHGEEFLIYRDQDYKPIGVVLCEIGKFREREGNLNEAVWYYYKGHKTGAYSRHLLAELARTGNTEAQNYLAQHDFGESDIFTSDDES